MRAFRFDLLNLLTALLLGTSSIHAATPSVALSVSQSAIPLGESVTLTATVSDGSGGPAHAIVVFCDATRPRCQDTAILATRSLKPDHTASFVWLTGVGTHAIKAVAVGVSSATKTVTVTGTPGTLVTAQQVGSSLPPSFNVSVLGTASAPPSGSVGSYEYGYSSFQGPYSSVTLGGQAKAISLTPTVISTGEIGILSGFIAAGDLSNNGCLDLVEPFFQGNELLIATNYSGTFSPLLSSAYTTGLRPLGVVLGDFNGDGNLDVATANSGSNNVSILLGHGDGTVTPLAAAPTTGTEPMALMTADLDGDGILDLAVANFSSGTITVLHGLGDGTFTLASTPTVGGSPLAIAVADLNGDGHLDLVAANQGGTLGVLLGKGNGTFQPATTIPLASGSQPQSVVAADFNGDGHPDLAVIIFLSNNGLSTNSVYVLLNDGHGGFIAPSSQPPAIYAENAAAIGDFNGDGIVDLAVTGSGPTSILVGKGDGTFTLAPAALAPTSFPPSSVAVADLNGDGVPDLALGGNESFTAAFTTTTVATATLSDVYLPGSGQEQLTLTYSGDVNNAGNQGYVETTAVNFPTGVSVVTPSSAAAGTTVLISANIFGVFTPQLGGEVTFTSGSTVLGRLGVGSDPFLIFVSDLPVGADPIVATYSGDGFYAPSTSAVTYIEITGKVGENNPQLHGQYAFLLSGYTTTAAASGTSRAIAAAGSFTADGKGNITAGMEDINSSSGFIGAASVTGTYSINADDRGTLNLSVPGEPTQTYAIVLETPTTSGGLATAGSLTSIRPGLVGGGRLVQQSTNGFNLVSENFGFALSGETTCLSACTYLVHPGGPIGTSGVLNLGASGALTGTASANVASTIGTDQALSGRFGMPSSLFDRFTLSFSSVGEASDLPTNFVGYIVDVNHIFLLSADSHARSALLSGTAVLQGAP